MRKTSVNHLQNLSARQLTQRKKLTQIALYTVWIGAAVALVAVVVRGALGGADTGMTLLMALVALLLSVPVYREGQQVERLLEAKKA